jgi:hypothetical protein
MQSANGRQRRANGAQTDERSGERAHGWRTCGMAAEVMAIGDNETFT